MGVGALCRVILWVATIGPPRFKIDTRSGRSRAVARKESNCSCWMCSSGPSGWDLERSLVLRHLASTDRPLFEHVYYIIYIYISKFGSILNMFNILNSPCLLILIGKCVPILSRHFQVPAMFAAPGGVCRRRSKIWRKRWPVPSTTCGRMWGNSRQDAAEKIQDMDKDS